MVYFWVRSSCNCLSNCSRRWTETDLLTTNVLWSPLDHPSTTFPLSLSSLYSSSPFGNKYLGREKHPSKEIRISNIETQFNLNSIKGSQRIISFSCQLSNRWEDEFETCHAMKRVEIWIISIHSVPANQPTNHATTERPQTSKHNLNWLSYAFCLDRVIK